MVEQTQEAGCDAVFVVALHYSALHKRHFPSLSGGQRIGGQAIIIYDSGSHRRISSWKRTVVWLSWITSRRSRTRPATSLERCARLETGLTWYSGDDGLFLLSVRRRCRHHFGDCSCGCRLMRNLANAFDQGDIHTAQKIAVQLSAGRIAQWHRFQAVMAKAALMSAAC